MAVKKTKPAAPVRNKAAARLPRAARPEMAPRPKETMSGPSEEHIAHRAYQLFIQRGAVHGHDREDWLIAERELGEASPA